MFPSKRFSTTLVRWICRKSTAPRVDDFTGASRGGFVVITPAINTPPEFPQASEFQRVHRARVVRNFLLVNSRVFRNWRFNDGFPSKQRFHNSLTLGEAVNLALSGVASSCRVLSCRVVSRRVASRRVASCRVASCRDVGNKL